MQIYFSFFYYFSSSINCGYFFFLGLTPIGSILCNLTHIVPRQLLAFKTLKMLSSSFCPIQFCLNLFAFLFIFMFSKVFFFHLIFNFVSLFGNFHYVIISCFFLSSKFHHARSKFLHRQHGLVTFMF